MYTTPKRLAFVLWTIVGLAIVPLTGCNAGDSSDATTAATSASDSTPTSGAAKGGETKGGPSGQTERPRKPVADAEDLEIQERWQRLDDPSRDGWDSEVFSSQAATQLKKLGSLLEKPADLTSGNIDSLAATEFSSGPLIPDQLTTVYQDDSFHIERPNKIDPADDAKPRYVGPAGLREALRELARPFEKAKGIRTKFKIFSVLATGDEAITRQYVEISGQLDDGMLEQHSTWEAHWSGLEVETPRISALKLIGFEQTRSRASGGTIFTDCTNSALAHNPRYNEQFLRSINYWLARSQNKRYLEFLSTPGLAVGDVNGDGLDDLYVCQEAGLPNRLFLQKPDGTADEVSGDWGVDWLEDCRGVLLLDFDNDGDQDLAVAFLGGVAIASNEGGKTFRLRTVVATSDDLMSLSASDFDSDGDLDIYAVALFANKKFEGQTRTASMPDSSRPEVYHDANNGGRNTFLRNDIQGDQWVFVDATEQVGLESNNSRFSFMGTWDDFDNDGDQDLYVANDFGRDNLYRNDGGHFVDVGNEAGAEDAASGMSAVWGDFNRDGWMDVYASNMWSSAGGRIAYQSKFKVDATAEQRRRLQRMARGNTLLQSTGDGRFRDISEPAGVTIGRWGWGAQFADINNDGWDDILASNGYVSGTSNTGDL